MKILWHSNAPFVPTGYGNQTGVFVKRLQALGHEVIVSAFYGLAGTVLEIDGARVLPGGHNGYGNDVLLAHAEYHDVDVVIGLHDIWVLNPEMLRALNRFYGWTPVDHDPLPPGVETAVAASRGVIAFSQFGVEMMRAAGFNPHYVPHGADSKAFAPGDKAAARQTILPVMPDDDVFVAGMVAANKGAPSRKCFDQQIRAFGKFHSRHPDSVLFLHTEMKSPIGEDLDRIIELAGIPKKRVAIINQYQYRSGMLLEGYMAHVYNALDVLLNASMGEGFGIPILEAQLCGTPVIVTDFSAMSELCFSGWKVGIADKIFTGQNSYQVIPAVAEIEDALEQAYTAKKNGTMADRQAAARLSALEYDADVVAERYWKPVLENIARELGVKSDAPAATAKTVYIQGQPLQIVENGRGGTSRDQAREIVGDYGLHEIALADGDVVIDVGANVGLVSIYLAKRFPHARIIAFEPMPETFAHLRANLEANRVTNVQAVNLAVTGDGRWVTIEGDLDDNAGGANIYGAPGATAHRVSSLTLQQILQEPVLGFGLEGARIALLKLDCEGAEHEIARHLAETGLLEQVDRVRAEVHVNNILTDEMAAETVALLERIPDCRISRMKMADSKSRGEVQAGQGVADVSLIIPTLNGAGTIARAIDAALQQSVQVEVIVIDDGSTDDTAQVLAGYGERIRVITHPENIGQVAAMNAGLAAATGKYILFHGDDDWLEFPHGLKPLVEALDNLPGAVGFAYGHLQYHGLRTDISPATPYKRDDYDRSFPAQTGVIWRREIAVKHGLQYRTLHAGKTAHAEDFDLIKQIIAAGYSGQAVNALVIHYTLAPNRATSWLHQHQDEVLPLWKERHPEFVGRL